MLCTCCTRVAEVRGLCAACYHAARKRVISGKTTWEELEKFGIAKASTRRGPKSALDIMMEKRYKLLQPGISPNPEQPEQPEQPAPIGPYPWEKPEYLAKKAQWDKEAKEATE